MEKFDEQLWPNERPLKEGSIPRTDLFARCVTPLPDESKRHLTPHLTGAHAVFSYNSTLCPSKSLTTARRPCGVSEGSTNTFASRPRNWPNAFVKDGTEKPSRVETVLSFAPFD